MIAPLRGVPDQLPHQRRRLGLSGVQLVAHVRAPRVHPQEGDLAQALRGLGNQQR
jgi:hypothetical protein